MKTRAIPASGEEIPLIGMGTWKTFDVTSGKAAGVRQMEESMRRLRVPRLDLMQVHNLLDAGTHLDTLRGWKADGSGPAHLRDNMRAGVGRMPDESLRARIAAAVQS